jgi:ubiquinone/menaquinone biosynthesis C-methylase UbiE
VDDVRHAIVLSLVAFVLHFGWESVQCPLLYVHGSYDATWAGMLRASAGDVLLTWTIFAGVAAVSRRWRWDAAPWGSAQWAPLVGLALVLAVAVELRALATGRWSYQPAMPLVPLLKVGAVPLLQLLILSPLSFRVATRLSGERERRNPSATEATRRRYDRIASLYDTLAWGMELRFRPWRRDLWARAAGERILELGVGTGQNLRFHPPGKRVVAIDLSERMLARARRRARRLGSPTLLVLADAEAQPYRSDSFDTVVATFLFCSVPDPVQGLREARRVLAPGGTLLLLEHVLSEKRLLRRLMRWLDPIPFHLSGAHIDRETVHHVEASGFADVEDEDLALDVVKRIAARAPGGPRTGQR